LERIERGRERVEVEQSCVLALGQIGTNDGKDPLDLRIRRVLQSLPRELSDPNSRAFALLAAAEVGARFGGEEPGAGVQPTRAFLVEQFQNGKSWLQPWAALALGVFARRLSEVEEQHVALASLRLDLRRALESEGSTDKLGALALGAGLAQSDESIPRLLELVRKRLPDENRGQVALALGLLEATDAVLPLQGIVADAKYRPELLREAAIGLALLGDKSAGSQLAEMLKGSRSLATQSSIATALGFIGDRRSVDALLALLEDPLATERAKAFAAVALGNVADKELVPWSAKIARGLNYRAAPPTLSDPLGGKGLLDLY
jgi:hypothetical protein